MASVTVPAYLLKSILQLNAIDDIIQAFEEFEPAGEHWDELERAVDDAWPPNDDKLMRISSAVLDIMKSDPDMNLQHVEAWLRRKQLAGVVWITSRTNPDPDRFDMVSLNGTSEKAPRSLWVIIRDPLIAVSEILSQEGIESYEDSFKLLLYTGVLCAKPTLQQQQQQQQ